MREHVEANEEVIIKCVDNEVMEELEEERKDVGRTRKDV